MENHICKKCGGIAGWDRYFNGWVCTRCGDIEKKTTQTKTIYIASDGAEFETEELCNEYEDIMRELAEGFIFIDDDFHICPNVRESMDKSYCGVVIDKDKIFDVFNKLDVKKYHRCIHVPKYGLENGHILVYDSIHRNGWYNLTLSLRELQEIQDKVLKALESFKENK